MLNQVQYESSITNPLNLDREIDIPVFTPLIDHYSTQVRLPTFNSTYRVGPAFTRIISSFFLKERDLSFLLSLILS
jgi:hypothetical protein